MSIIKNIYIFSINDTVYIFEIYEDFEEPNWKLIPENQIN
jgi:hypothetical protein